MPTVTAVTPGTFCWLELAAHDTGAARRFYTELFGWTPVDTKYGPGDEDIYTIYRLDGQDAAASYGMMGDQRSAGIPSNWLSYIAVEDVDASAARARELGGTVVGGPMDVMEHGRMAVV